jgi:predicted ArsR family transcriptional regulator
VGVESPEGAAVRARLYDGAREIGRSVRRLAGIRTPEEAARALRLIYAAIDIDLRVDVGAGSATVRRCAFSSFYTPAVCRFVSALDAGLFHGVSGAWSVEFADRITEGAGSCLGHLEGRPNQ